MKSSINATSLWFVIETLKKKVKQWKYYLPIINLVFFMGVISLAIICVLLGYHSPENIIKSEQYKEKIFVREKTLPPLVKEAKTIDYYEPLLTNNPFSPNRTRWVSPETKKNTKTGEHEEREGEGEVAQTEVHQEKPKGTPVKINLQGVLILGNTKKALIENPDKTNNKKPFLFVEEGEEVAEYKVKSIEPDLIKLDWYGEEQIVIMRPSLKE